MKIEKGEVIAGAAGAGIGIAGAGASVIGTNAAIVYEMA